MSVHTRKHPTRESKDFINMRHAGVNYQFPKQIAEKYRVNNDKDSKSVSSDEVFADLNKKYTRPGVLLRGIRAREDLTQIEMAKKIKVTQSDISQMENGTRAIGRKIAKRIEKLFDVSYRSFLE